MAAMRAEAAVVQALATRVHVVRLDAFRQRYARWLPGLDLETQQKGEALRSLGLRRVLVVSRCRRHNQSTQWWYEQALLSVLAAAQIEVTFVTDGHFVYDLPRISALGPAPALIEGPDAPLPRGPFDAVVALPPSDAATRASAHHRAPLVACVLKRAERGQPVLHAWPRFGTRLWHGFAASRAFAPREVTGFTRPAWSMRAMPFPMNRYYAPHTDAAPTRSVLLFGTVDRDVTLALLACREAGEARLTILGRSRDRAEVLRLASSKGIAVEWFEDLAHDAMIDLVESCAVILNPVSTESHYSLAVAIALGRPVLVTRSRAARAFFEEGRRGVRLLARSSVRAWASAIDDLRDPSIWTRAALDAAERAAIHHDAERFFVRALTETIEADRRR
jgi:hypothetical protein